MPIPASGAVSPPVLCVDLDGTLVKSDTLVDSTLALVRQHPAAILQIPRWLAQGKAALKRHITSAVQLDVDHLPYNRELLQYIEQQQATGPDLSDHHRRFGPCPSRRRSSQTLYRSP